MRFADVLLTALGQIRANKLRSFFTLLGIIVSVGFLVAVIAIIQGMNAYVKENIADAMVGSNERTSTNSVSATASGATAVSTVFTGGAAVTGVVCRG